jgi:nitrogen regulatory protein PII-like uncharacterized protein
MFDKKYFEYWLKEFYNITPKDWKNLSLDKQCELITNFSDEMIMEMDL